MKVKTLAALLFLMLLFGAYIITDDGPLRVVNSIAWVGALLGIMFVFVTSNGGKINE